MPRMKNVRKNLNFILQNYEKKMHCLSEMPKKICHLKKKS